MAFPELELRVPPCCPELSPSPLISFAEALWIAANRTAQEKLVDRSNSLVLDFTGEEIPMGEKWSFPDEEYAIRLPKKTVSDQKAAYFFPPIPNAGKILEVAMFCDNLRQLGVQEITWICPWLAYTRADQLAPSHLPYVIPITIRLFADMMRPFMDRLVITEPHSEEVSRYFTEELQLPVVALSPWRYLLGESPRRYVPIGPDEGRESIAARIAKYLGARYLGEDVPLVSLKKYRNPESGEVFVEPLTEEQTDVVRDKQGLAHDDVISTASSIEAIGQRLKEAGLAGLRIQATHGIFSGKAVSRLTDPFITEIKVTNSRLPVTDLAPLKDKLLFVPINPFLREFLKADRGNPDFNPWRDPNFRDIVCY